MMKVIKVIKVMMVMVMMMMMMMMIMMMMMMMMVGMMMMIMMMMTMILILLTYLDRHQNPFPLILVCGKVHNVYDVSFQSSLPCLFYNLQQINLISSFLFLQDSKHPFQPNWVTVSCNWSMVGNWGSLIIGLCNRSNRELVILM